MEWILVLTLIYPTYNVTTVTVPTIQTSADCVRIANNHIKALEAQTTGTKVKAYYSCTEVRSVL